MEDYQIAKSKGKSSRRSSNSVPRSESQVRIIGGDWRGRLIEYSGDARTRPMKHRVREAMFNLVGPKLEGTLAIDLFAGTGAIGFEALSRGAEAAIFIERHLPTTSVLESNAELLDARDFCEIAFADTFIWVRQNANDLNDDFPWSVFCCPPYSFYQERKEDMIGLISKLMDVAPKSSLFVIESEIDSDLNGWPVPEDVDIREYPPAKLAIFQT